MEVSDRERLTPGLPVEIPLRGAPPVDYNGFPAPYGPADLERIHLFEASLHVDVERNRSVVRKLARLLARVPSHPLPETVHQFRTLSRRTEAVLDVLCPQPGDAERKLLRSLKRLRRRAGAVRDLDVQMAALRKLKIGREAEHRARLMNSLAECRADREQELLEWLTDRRRNRLRRRLSRCAASLDLAARRAAQLAGPAKSDGKDADFCAGVEQVLRSLDPAPEALRRFAAFAGKAVLTGESLHAFRTDCKRVRYVAEMGSDERSRHLVERLKQVQDVVGDWHDWDTLRAAAEKMFGRSVNSALVMALENVTQAKFEKARLVAGSIRKELLAEYRAVAAAEKPPRRKAPRSAPAPKQMRAGQGVA